ncbi:MAG: tetratricopeptide repeat protein [Sandaracinus sp.]|nr:tetratricopeptide repeat protein [Sandaracinus sp.]MCB9618221.1 tetratricopeptide repeat protein [Sandaracinus sp.]MCB9625399.1 tetratricopeptide repeat protein [Sandaracinus sp.]
MRAFPRTAAWLVAIVAACGEEAPSPAVAPTVVEAIPEPPSSNDPVPRALPRCDAIGRTSIPEVPSAEARRANREGLTAHERGDHTAALARFERALELAPDYENARFNAACALARLGRVDEAWERVRALACTDLPSFAPRALRDPDLEGVRAAHDVAAFVAAEAVHYEGAMREGVPLVAYREEPIVDPGNGAYGGAVTAQAGVWLHAEHRFVPLSPNLRVERGEAPTVAPLVDVARGQVVVVTTTGSSAEGPAPIPTRVRLFAAGTGDVLADARVGGEPLMTDVGVAADGIVVRVTGADSDHDDPPTTYRFDASGLRRVASAPATPLFVRVGPLGWWLRAETPSLSLPASARVPTTLAGVPIFARGSRRQRLHHSGWLDEARGLGVVLAADWGDCGAPDRYTLEVVDVAAGRSVREIEGRGQVHPMLGRDGALYLQVGDELRRFADPRVDVSEPLPAGLGITSRPIDSNPYC